MLAALSRTINRWATWPNILVVTLAAMLGAWVDIVVVGPAFAAATGGIPVFDLQPGLTPALIWQQLPHYTPESIRIYGWFFWLDNVFPLAAFTAVALLWSRLLAQQGPPWAVRLAWTALIPFSTLVFDWAENLAFIGLVKLYPAEMPWLAALACGLHFGKFACLAVTNAGIVVLAVAAGATSLRRRGFGRVA